MRQFLGLSSLLGFFLELSDKFNARVQIVIIGESGRIYGPPKRGISFFHFIKFPFLFLFSFGLKHSPPSGHR